MIEQVNFKKISGLVFFLFLGTYLMSCTTIDPRFDVGTKQPSFEENLNILISKMTYDEALMTWGEPASLFEGDELFIATWGNKKDGGAVFPIGKTWFAMPIESGWKLQLSFSKTTRKMLSWRYEKW